uniref:hypothetical protein n=1 Tax=Streptomyces sp. GSL17-113 TaxID=3115365 RepID=UPI002E79DE28
SPGSAASYYPETNVLVPLDSVADFSNCPTSKGIVVRLEPARSITPGARFEDRSRADSPKGCHGAPRGTDDEAGAPSASRIH